MGPAQTKGKIDTYVQGKSWAWYLPLWLFGLYAYVQLFNFDMVKGNMPFVLLVPYSFDFILHEFAHIATSFLPPVLCASAGSVSELLLGLGLVLMATRQRSYFASLFCFLWFDLTCQSAGTYMADAVPQKLPLVSLGAALNGGEPKHDWNFVFGQLHLLWASAFIGNTLRVIGTLAGTFGVAFAAWLLYRMSRTPRWTENKEQSTPRAIHTVVGVKPAKPTPDEGFTSLPLSYRQSGSAASPGQPDDDVGKK